MACCDLVGVYIVADLTSQLLEMPIESLSSISFQPQHIVALIILRVLGLGIFGYLLNSMSLQSFNNKILNNIVSDTSNMFGHFANDSEIDTKYGVSRWGYINTFLIPKNNLITEIYVIIILVSFFIFTVGFEVLVIIGLFGLLMFPLLYLSRKQNRKISSSRLHFENENTLQIQSTRNLRYFFDDKSVKKFFFSMLEKSLSGIANIVALEYVFLNLPRYFMEALVFLALLSLVVTNSAALEGGNFVVLAIGAIRLLPSAIRVGSSLQSISLSRKFRDVFIPVKIEKRKKTVLLSQTGDMLSLILNDFSYFGNSIQSSCQMPTGSIILLDGVSGSGKSYFVDRLAESLRDKKQTQTGFMPQNTAMFSGSLIDNIVLGRTIQKGQLAKILELAGLDAEFTSDDLTRERSFNRAEDKLSGGQKQRIGFARALVGNPRIIFLDEPTAGLDEKASTALCLAIKKIKCDLIILISHEKNVQNISTCSMKFCRDEKELKFK
jgi:ABC-type transport system involved in cytochrome bd biosynthesis fused ATPase/permease subunit